MIYVHAEERLNYDISNEKLIQFFKDNPKATAKQAAEFYDELIHPIALNWFEKLMWSKGRRQLFGLVGTEEERLAKKKARAAAKKEIQEESPYPEYPDAFLEDGVWKVIRDGKTYRIE